MLLAATTLTVAWLALLIFAPLLSTPLAASLYAMGSLLCHQIPERSFHLFGAQLPVCARCVGIYAGGAVGMLTAMVLLGKPRRRPWANFLAMRGMAVSRPSDDEGLFFGRAPGAVLVIGAVPTALTVATERLGVWHFSNLARGLAGLPAGIAVAIVVAGAVATLHYGGCTPRRPIESNHPSPPI